MAWGKVIVLGQKVNKGPSLGSPSGMSSMCTRHRPEGAHSGSEHHATSHDLISIYNSSWYF
jgi:hypothetical protein